MFPTELPFLFLLFLLKFLILLLSKDNDVSFIGSTSISSLFFFFFSMHLSFSVNIL